MTLPAGFPYPLKQEVEIPLEQIIPNPDQPRKFEHQEAIQLLAASLRAKGQEVAARVRPLTEEERTANPGAWVMLIGGHGRREAALLNQFKTLKCTVEDITPEETLSTAARDNSIRDMHWWEWYLLFEAVDKASHKSQREIAEEFGQYETKVYTALKVTKTLNQAARVLVQENIQKSLILSARIPGTKNKGFLINESHLLVLADLEDPDRVQRALQVVLDDYLTTDQTKKLVAHIQTGQAVDTYKATTAVRSSKLESSKLKPTNPNSPLQTPHADSSDQGAHASHGSPESAQSNRAPRLEASEQMPTPDTKGHHQEPLAQPNHGSRLVASTQALAQEAKKGLHWLKIQKVIHWFKKLAEWLIKIGWRGLMKYEHHMVKSIAHYLVPVKDFSLRQGYGRQVGSSTHQHSHHQKGLPFSPTTMVAMILHWFVYTLLQLIFWWITLTWLASRFAPVLTPWVKWPFQWLAHLAFNVLPDMVWLWASTNVVPAIVVGVLLFIGISFAYKTQPQRMFFLTAVVAALWFYGQGYSSSTPWPKLQAEEPVPTVQAAAISTPTITESKSVAVVPKKTVVTSLTQPTPAAIKKTDVADDVLKAAPAGVDAVRHLLPF